MNQKTRQILFFGKVALVIFVFFYWMFIFIDFNVAWDNEKTSIWVHGPSIVETNEQFELDVEIWDPYERLAGRYNGEISFGLESYDYNTFASITSAFTLPDNYLYTTNFIWRGLIPSYMITGADNGKKSFSMSISTPGIHYVVISEADGKAYRSNPIIVKSKGTLENHLYWGDIHAHTEFSDGSGTPDHAYQYARDVALLDFAALTDHAELMPRIGEIDVFNVFETYKAITNKYNQDGIFSTIIAMEYTPMLASLRSYLSPQHLNVYFSGDDMPYFCHYNQVNQDELIRYIEQNSQDDFVLWTHHTTRESQCSDFGYYDPQRNTMTEIYSCHGSSEVIGDENWYPEVGEVSDPGYSIRDALKMGRKCGIMASSDSHDGLIGHNILHTNARTIIQQPYSIAAFQYGVPYPGGLTGLYIPELTRSNVFNALKIRSGYATNWINRHYVEFSINGVSVGENNSTVRVLNTNSNRNIEVVVCIDGLSLTPSSIKTIDKIEIIKNSELWKTLTVDDKFMERWTVSDSEPITGTSFDECIQKADGNWYVHEQSTKPVNLDELNTNGADYYYIRIKDSQKGAAWIGPIWVEVA